MTQLTLGNIVTTAGVADWVRGLRPETIGIAQAVLRHRCEDWGQVCPEDWQANDEAVKKGDRVLSAYEVCGRKIWIITEADRSVTTVLFPEEY